MKKLISVLLCVIALIIAPGFTGITTLSAQSWTSIDGGGTYGISSTTANSNYPSLAVFNGELYAIWQENFSGEDQIHIKKYNGSTWSPVGNIAGQSQLNTNLSNAWSPKIVTCNGALYAAWYEYGDGITRIRVKKYDGSTWTFAENYAVGDGRTNIASLPLALAIKVDIIVFNNELYATWVETEPSGSGILQIRVAKFNGSVWSLIDGGTFYGINYDKTMLATNSTLCVFNNKLYAAWTESDASNILQLRVKRYDGGSTWTFVDGNGLTGLNYNTATTLFDGPLSLSSYDGKMYVFWAESNRVRAKRYDEINGWVADPADGGTGIGWCHNSTNVAYYPSSCSYDKLYVTWEQNPIPRQVRVASYDGTTRTFIDGNTVAVGINNTTANRAHFPKLIEYRGDLAAVWSEELTSAQGSANQIRAKIYPLPPMVESVDVPAIGTYITGQILTFTVHFSKYVNVAGGTPYIPVTLNTGGTVNATYHSGTGTKTLTFRYIVASGNADPDGVTVGSSIILPGGCTLRDASTLDASLTLNSVGSATGVLVDAIGPTVTSVSSTNMDGYYNAGGIISITINCSEAATVTNTPTLALNSGGTASYTSGSGSTVLTFSYTVASGHNSTDLDYSTTSALSLSGGTIKDATGNDAVLTLPTVGGPSSLSGQKDIVIDNSAPTVSISSVVGDPTNTSPFQVTFTFGESVTGFVVGDISTNGTAGSFTTVNAYTYTASITPSANGTVTVNVAGSVATDAAGNSNTAATALTRVYDNVAPAAPTIIGISVGHFNTNQTFTVSGEAGATIEYSTNNGGLWSTYSGAVNLSAEGTYNVLARQTDQAGNGPTASGAITLTIDKTAPAASTITGISAGYFNTNQTFTVSGEAGATIEYSTNNGDLWSTYSGAVTLSAEGTYNLLARQTDQAGNGPTVSGAITLNIDKTAPAAPTIIGISVGHFNTNQTFTVSGEAGATIEYSTNNGGLWSTYSGAVNLSAEGTYNVLARQTDQAGNGPTSSGVITLTVDKTAPSAPTITGISAGYFNSNQTFTVSGEAGATIEYSINNGGFWTSYSGAVTLSAEGTYNVLARQTDQVGNGPTSSGVINLTIDKTAPTVIITSTATDPTNASIPATITFNESVTGFVVGDITVTNGIAGNFSGSGTTYTADIFPTGQGAVTVTVAAGVAQDALGNNNIAATQLSRTYDNIVPAVLSVSSSTNDGAYKTGDVISITTTFSEVVVVTGTPTLELNSGGLASYVSGSGSAILTFSYTVASGNSCLDLDYLSTSSLSLSGGTIMDEAGNISILTLPEIGGSSSLGGQKNILIGNVSTVTTQAVTDILATTATGNGNITDLGYPTPIAYGVCWNTTGAPTISDSKADNGAISSTGAFTGSMTDLPSGTTFYVRAFVTNTVSTSYGDETSFTTDGIITYELNGGTNHLANTDTYVYGTGLTLSDPTRTGYTFGGWYDNETFTGSAITAISNTTKGDVTLYAKWNSATGVNYINSIGITVYPNPARDVVFIEGAKGFVYIYDISSNMVLTQQIDKNNSIDISSLVSGVYFVNVNNKNYKLIKE